MSKATATNNLIPYPVIVLAASGDIDAINAVLNHFGDYLSVLATKRLYDEYGNPYLCIDGEVRRRLETKLITAILKFNAA